ncbi:MAG: hypothetical protein ACK4NY_01945 [Spirosomataceae bacterium]
MANEAPILSKNYINDKINLYSILHNLCSKYGALCSKAVYPASGCKLITEESQNGWLTLFERTFQGKKLQKLLDLWLFEIKNQAESKQ